MPIMHERQASLLSATLWTLVWLAEPALGHAIKRTSLPTSSEPVFTIQTSMPPSSSGASSAVPGCTSNGSCPTSTVTATDSGGEEEPVFCPAPTSLPSGLCYSTLNYTISATTRTGSTSSSSANSTEAAPTTTSSVRMYPCAESTTVYSSATYAINCLDKAYNYIACPSNITITPVPTSAILVNASSSTNSDCINEQESTITCNIPTTRRTVLTACYDTGCPTITSTPSSIFTPTLSSSTIARTRSIITQCFNATDGSPVPCPKICATPFETAPGPVIPTASLSLEVSVNEGSSTSTSEKIFQTSPAPIIPSFASAPAFLTSGLSVGS